jgi:hypothetical protein
VKLVISIICVFNNKQTLERYLLESLKIQENKYQLILVDNTQKRFSSAAQALNYGASKANGDYFMFAHQDMEFTDPQWLEEVETTLKPLINVGIAGVAGKIHRNLVSNMFHNELPVLSGNYPITKPQQVQTLDECLFIIPQKVFQDYQFDEVNCDNWHLYAVDYCLTVSAANLDVYVIPESCYHHSTGYAFSDDYYSTLKKIINKHKEKNHWIYTTNGNWHTSHPMVLQKIYNRLIYYFVKFRRNYDL